MKTVSLRELEARLSELVAEAAAGESIVITRHNRPIARLSGITNPHVHVGDRFGKGAIRPMFKGLTKGRYLEILEEDRRDREGR